VALTRQTYYPFDKFGWEDANFIIHPQHYFMAAKIQDDGLWRITYGEEPGLTKEQLIERQPWKFETFLPGHPKPDSGAYKVVTMSPYKMHNRCASSFRVGRILLVADAGKGYPIMIERQEILLHNSAYMLTLGRIGHNRWLCRCRRAI